MLDLGWRRLLRGARGWLLAFAAVGALVWALYQEPALRRSLVQTATVIEREWIELPEVRCTVPDSARIAVGTLLTVYLDDGTDEVIGEVGGWTATGAGAGVELRIRLLPEAAQHLTSASRLEVIYPPRSGLEAASLVFTEDFQALLEERVLAKAGVLFEERIRPRAYTLLAQAFTKVRPGDTAIEEFIESDLFPKLQETFADDFEAMKAKLLADLKAGLSTWDQVNVGWSLLFGDGTDAEGVLEPLAVESLQEFWLENKAALQAKVEGIWPQYEGRALAYFEEVIVPILLAEVLDPLFQENKQVLLDRALEELRWAYGETILAGEDGRTFDRMFVYAARNIVLNRDETKLFVRPSRGEALADGAELPVRTYFRPDRPRFHIDPPLDQEAP